MIFICISRIRI